MAIVISKNDVFAWEGKNSEGRIVKGEMRATSDAVVRTNLRRQGILVRKTKKVKFSRRGKVTEKDIVVFTRQLATMMKSGVPMLQAFEITGRGHANPAVGNLIMSLKADVETGLPLSQAFAKFPKHFDPLFVNLVGAGEKGGILDTLLDRLATYKEKILAIKGRIKSAMFYPTAVIVVSIVITTVIMLYVIPAFKDIFKSFGADLPAITLYVIEMSDFFVEYWWVMFGILGLAVFLLIKLNEKSLQFQIGVDRLMLKLPIFGPIFNKAAIARWCRTLATMFAAGVPLVESLTSVGGAAGNHVFRLATEEIQQSVSGGTSLAQSVQHSQVFPNMVVQMITIGEESGALDSMLGKIADFFEREVDDSVDALSSLMEPLIMVVLGVLIGGIVIAMYLPIFKIGAAV